MSSKKALISSAFNFCLNPYKMREEAIQIIALCKRKNYPYDYGRRRFYERYTMDILMERIASSKDDPITVVRKFRANLDRALCESAEDGFMLHYAFSIQYATATVCLSLLGVNI